MNRERHFQVLQAIIEDYVHSREPVGSKALIERHSLGVSSATVRNDMAHLEEQGLISAPHASAGRIPTNDGYRLFVDKIAGVRPLNEPQRRAIAQFLDGATDIDQLMDRTVRLLSQLTRQVAVIQHPVEESLTIRHIDVIEVADRQLMVLVVLSNAEVLQRVLTFDATDHNGQSQRQHINSAAIAALLRSTYLGQPLEQLGRVCPASTGETSYPVALNDALQQLADEAKPHRMTFAGTSYLAQSTQDFPHSIAPILDALEEQVVVLRLLEELSHDQRGFSVKIGAESQLDPLTDAAVVATGYGFNNTAKIGIVGPIRMDYPGNITLVRAVASYLSKTLNH
ncbi:heat-inducible transcriptional repressor HrcA [Rothia sp. ZJ932]|uniref:heat-inducible transcriptional repressor HrcA n=1 Tax=Rothia sp. ZJ932 TaxID=2810516 RepID=UPI0019676516|nr:heat-inducible transcriptional repressor HrcA [Rothia sp. ZJ932]QRZ60719.1 heat-inducible transcription repressor HrcA [Rothia sp. ZJ932]